MEQPNQPTTLAAVDLGSNSFHLIVAREEHGEIRPVERIGEKVQLAAGIGKKGKLSSEAIGRGLSCLARFRQVLDSLQPDLVRVVGTNTLRAAKNSKEFTVPAEAVLGCPVEIIPGREEARLIYLGVAHTLADDEQSRLVVDIGGGSTEFAIGQRFEPKRLESLHMGCVSYMKRFFDDGKITEKAFQKAFEAASLEVLSIRDTYRQMGWQECVGSSGTLLAVHQVLLEQGWATEAITSEGLVRLKQAVLAVDRMDNLNLSGLKENRRTVFPSGLAITCALFDVLGIGRMTVSNGALREGVVYDMIGRLRHEDVRERSVNALMQRCAVDDKVAGRVEQVARQLYEFVCDSWKLNQDDKMMLCWAARLHEIGLTIAHNQFHKHGEYLIHNSDLPGFSQRDQQVLALLVRSHRRKLPVELFRELPKKRRSALLKMAMLLRLAVLFKYAVQEEGAPEFTVSAEGKTLSLNFPLDWLSRHPLTANELENEAELISDSGYLLQIR